MKLTIFENEEFGKVRTMTDEKGEPWFCLKDVCEVLGLRTFKVVQRLGDDILSKYSILDSLGREQMATFVSEDGLYDVILDSRKPEARAFRKWVTAVVLPQIRRTGGYVPVKADDDEVTIMARALKIMTRTLERKDELLEAQRPHVEFAKALIQEGGSVLVGEFAKILTKNGFKMGATRLFNWLRNNGYLFKRSTQPIQRWVERGLFEVSYAEVKHNHGFELHPTTRITPLGQRYLLERLQEECFFGELDY